MRPLAIALLFAAACGAKPAPSTSTPTADTTSTPESTPPADDTGNACYDDCMAKMPDAVYCNGECGAFDDDDDDYGNEIDECIEGCMSAGDDQETCEGQCAG